MATAIIHGDPGSYKTSSLVSDYLVPGVKQGRLVITNIRGVKPLQDIAALYNFELPPTAQIINVPFDKNGFRHIAKFFHWAPPGALILMDEGQRVYPTRLRDFSFYDFPDQDDTSRPHTVEDAFDSHRHYNWDIYISTPNIGKIHKEIRAVAEFGFRHKNLATVFSFMKGRYKRVAHNAENSGNAMGHTISASLRKIDSRCFDVYQSTSTGQTTDSKTGFSVFKQPRIIMLLLVIVYSVWNFGSALYANGGLPAMFGGSSKPAVSSPRVESVVVPGQAPGSLSPGAVSPGITIKNPFAGLTIYLVGSINNSYWFQVVYPDMSTQQINQDELEAIGYNIAVLSTRVVQLTFGGQSQIAMPKPEPHFQPSGVESAQNGAVQPFARL